jgi:hypothetical protein
MKWFPFVIITRRRHERYIAQTNVLMYLARMFKGTIYNKNAVAQFSQELIVLSQDLIEESLTGKLSELGIKAAKHGINWRRAIASKFKS